MAKLLLVEDDNNLREIYEARLQAEGYTIVCARDGEEALVVAKAEKPDLIISDVMMPKISGFEMLDILRNTEELKNLKVIMLTALGQSDDQHLADRLGADRYMVKSQVTLEDIVKVTHELLEDAESAAEPTVDPIAQAAPDVAVDANPVAAIPPPSPVPEPVPSPSPVPVEEPVPAPGGMETAAAEAIEAIESLQSPEITTTPSPDPTSPGDGAISTAQEEADVKNQIEDFVAGADPRSVEPSSESQLPTNTVQDVPPSTPSGDEVTNNQVTPSMYDSSNATDSQNTATPEPPDDTSDVAPAATPTPMPPVSVAPSTPPQPTPSTSSNSDDDTQAHSVTIANKKVIKPLELPPKKDLSTLLALEEANEAAKQAPVSATVTPTNNDEQVAESFGTPPISPLSETPAPITPSASSAESSELSGIDEGVLDTSEPTPTTADEPVLQQTVAAAPTIGKIASTVPHIPINPPDNPIDPNSIAL